MAGTGTPGNTGDGGLPTSARLLFPYGIAVDSLGNIFSVDTYNHAIRMISTSTGIITTVAGTVGTFGYSGDGGLATSATLFYPGCVAVDTSGNIYIADSNNDVIQIVRKSNGIITTIAGTGMSGYSGDGGLATA